MKTKYEHLTKEDVHGIDTLLEDWENGIPYNSDNVESALKELIDGILSYFDIGMPDWNDLSKEQQEKLCESRTLWHNPKHVAKADYNQFKDILTAPPKKRYVKSKKAIMQWLVDNGYEPTIGGNFIKKDSEIWYSEMWAYCEKEIKYEDDGYYLTGWQFHSEWTEEK